MVGRRRELRASQAAGTVDGVDPDDLLSGLNEAQGNAVAHHGGPLVVIAGAGSGKTRVLTRRIAYRVARGDTDPRRVLALTFTRKAAGELRHRLRRLGLRDDVVAGTFHGVALTQLRQRWAERGITPPTILDRKYRLIGQLLGRRRGVDPLDVLAEVEWARARLITPEIYPKAAPAAGRTPPMPPEELADLMERFAQEKRRRRVVDFDDLLALACRDLQADPDYAAGVRWRHRHLYVDEFQDVNPLQFELLRAWRGDSDDLFVVGDPRQAIYGWNGADPNLLGQFAEREPQSTVIELSQNYRSTPQILTLASATLQHRGGQLEALRGDGPVPDITAYPTDLDEAAGLAAALRTAKRSDRAWSDHAVLVRTNAQLAPIEQALIAVGIPVRVRGGSGPLSSQEVKAEIRALTRDRQDLRRALEELDGGLAQLDDRDEEVTPGELERRQNLAALSRLVHEYLTIDPDPSGPGLRAWLATIQAGEVQRDHDAVELATFHGSKGLEWPIVFLAGLEQGFVPISYAKTGAQLAEEQRLLYVAITRAEDELHLSWAATRTFGTRATKRQPSPELDHINQAITHLRRGRRPVDWRAQVDRSRHAITKSGRGGRAPNPVDDPVFDALRSWRRDRARAADVPAFVVFNDQTLRALAKRRPATRAQLAGMPGMGAVKLERYGDEVLAVIEAAAD